MKPIKTPAPLQPLFSISRQEDGQPDVGHVAPERALGERTHFPRGKPQKTGRCIGHQAAAQNGQVASQDQTGVEVQVEGGRADLPDQKGGNGDKISQVADLVQEELIDKAECGG